MPDFGLLCEALCIVRRPRCVRYIVTSNCVDKNQMSVYI